MSRNAQLLLLLGAVLLAAAAWVASSPAPVGEAGVMTLAPQDGPEGANGDGRTAQAAATLSGEQAEGIQGPERV